MAARIIPNFLGSEASDIDGTDIESDTNDDRAANVNVTVDKNDNATNTLQKPDTKSYVVEPVQQNFASLLTCKEVRVDAEPFVFSEASFIFNNCASRYIYGPDFAINSRIHNLEIVQEPGLELWGGHYHLPGATLSTTQSQIDMSHAVRRSI